VSRIVFYPDGGEIVYCAVYWRLVFIARWSV